MPCQGAKLFQPLLYSSRRWRCFWTNAGLCDPLLPGATGSPDGAGAVFGGTKGGLIGAGGAGKSTTEDFGFTAGTFLAAAAGLAGATTFTGSTTTFSTFAETTVLLEISAF